MINEKKACDFTVDSLKDLELKIVPFFKQYPMQGPKHLNFEDFNKVIKIMKTKDHLTEQGLQNIKDVKANVNTAIKL